MADTAWVRTPPAVTVGEPRSARRKAPRPWGLGVRVATLILKPILFLWTRPTWVGLARVPATGPLILAVNHASVADPIAIADLCCYGLGRVPSFLAKSSLFRLPVAGRILRAARQIPVYRDRPEGGGALDAAVDALGHGACVVVYPEGTVTKAPAGWPMRARTGTARLALTTGAPVHPVGQWGAQQLIGPHGSGSRLRPRTRVAAVVGDEVDLSRWRGRPLTPEVLDGATADIMAAVLGLVEVVRGETAPPGPAYDPRAAA